MKSLDTNIVRFLVRDDEAMTTKARELLEAARNAGESLLVSNLVLLETLWVLGSVYRLAPESILVALEQLQRMPPICFESDRLVREFVRAARGSKLDLADALIGVWSRELKCEFTWTFDHRAAGSELFEKIP